MKKNHHQLQTPPFLELWILTTHCNPTLTHLGSQMQQKDDQKANLTIVNILITASI